MPIEIKELFIKATVSTNTLPSGNTTVSQEEIAKLKKEITREVTDKVLRLLQQKNER